MIKSLSAIVLLLFFVPFPSASAQSHDDGRSKIYSGYFHQSSRKGQHSIWHALFGKKDNKQNQVDLGRQCSIEFKSPIVLSHEEVTQLPQELTYFIKFKNGEGPKGEAVNEGDALGKFIIKVYTDDDQEYSIDPEAEGKQIGINDEHHIFDTYLIYLILGQQIDHLEVVSSAGDDNGKYVLDKLEIQSDD